MTWRDRIAPRQFDFIPLAADGAPLIPTMVAVEGIPCTLPEGTRSIELLPASLWTITGAGELALDGAEYPPDLQFSLVGGPYESRFAAGEGEMPAALFAMWLFSTPLTVVVGSTDVAFDGVTYRLSAITTDREGRSLVVMVYVPAAEGSIT